MRRLRTVVPPHTYVLLSIGLVFVLTVTGYLFWHAVEVPLPAERWIAFAGGVVACLYVGAAAGIVLTWPRDQL